MKKLIDIARLIFFFIAGMSIYFYMGNALAAQTNEPRYIIRMTANESYKIWSAINKLEKPWYVTEEGSLDIVPLSKNKQDELRGLVRGYEELEPLVEDLIKAREEGDLKKFMKQKEKIAEILREKWRQGALKAQQRLGWLAWIKNNLKRAINNVYSYFFPAATMKTKLVGEFDEATDTYTVKTISEGNENI